MQRQLSQLQSAAQRQVVPQVQGLQSLPLPHVSQVQGPAGSMQVQRPVFGAVLLLLAFMSTSGEGLIQARNNPPGTLERSG